MKKLVLGLHGKVVAIAEKLEPLAPLLLRLAVGGVFVVSGWGKLHALDNVIEFFRSLGIPAPELQAPFVAGLEFVGGLALLVGFATRYFAVPLAITMVVAILTAVWKPDSTFTDLIAFQEFTYILVFAALAILGAGPLSVDAVLKKKFGQAA
jgi:putative oxidoreductase